MYLAQLNDEMAEDKSNDVKALELAQNLVQHGADITLKNRVGHTALYIARRNHLKRLVNYLETLERARGRN
jgi:ankyrin repeat protein